MPSTFEIKYILKLPDRPHQSISMTLDRETLALVTPPTKDPPLWTALCFQQCENCPYTPEQHPHCPLALYLVDVVELCKDLPSYETLLVEARMPSRTVITETTAQRGLASLMGLLIATSGCPHTAFFRPMARFHLPFATEEETIVRATSIFLLAQYFVRQGGGQADLDLDDLVGIYREMQIVNRAISRRLVAAVELDSSINALVLLDLFSKALPDTIDDRLEEIRYLFNTWLDQRTPLPLFKRPAPAAE
jgi:hypothetical protein